MRDQAWWRKRWADAGGGEAKKEQGRHLRRQLQDGALLREGVHVQDGRVASSEDRLVLEQLDDHELRLKPEGDGGGRVGGGRPTGARLVARCANLRTVGQARAARGDRT